MRQKKKRKTKLYKGNVLGFPQNKINRTKRETSAAILKGKRKIDTNIKR